MSLRNGGLARLMNRPRFNHVLSQARCYATAGFAARFPSGGVRFASNQEGERRHVGSVAKLSTAVSVPDMFCRQCEQTQNHHACVTVGVCGKTAETSACQDALMHCIRAVSCWCQAVRAHQGDQGHVAHDGILEQANVWTLEAVFSTLTNVNFSEQRIVNYIKQGEHLKRQLKEVLPEKDHPMAAVAHIDVMESDDLTIEQAEAFGLTVSVPKRAAEMNHDDAFALNELATYGLKGMCAYAAHAYQLQHAQQDGSSMQGSTHPVIMEQIHDFFAELSNPVPDLDAMLKTVQNVGECSATVLALLDEAHSSVLGQPEPVEVLTTAVEGKCILVSGHDLVDLRALLEQTEGTGVNVYTHGEMLPAHGYPELRKFPHLVGNFGTAWQAQKFEFAQFPGPIVVTTNCIIEPRRSYRDRIYTMNATGLDGVHHIDHNRDFSPVIEQAKTMKGFPTTIEPPSYHVTGYNHRAVLPLISQVKKAIEEGSLSHIFVIGGCDGSQWDRSYFTDLAEATPDDSIILTMGCAKNRLIRSEKLHKKTLANGMPRVLDLGQCNDSYSAVVIATELAKAMDCTINELPLSLAVSHLEQKAVSVLLTLLSLGVKNIRLGPSLPAYLTPTVLHLLQQHHNLMPNKTAEEDISAMLEGK